MNSYPDPTVITGTIPQVVGLKSHTSKLVRWDQYSYYALTPENNDYYLIVIAFDSDGIEVKRWQKSDYRYAKDIEIDEQNQKITFIMKQSNYGNENDGFYPVSFDWNELRIH
ncbi:hypothetical protein BRE01_48530 [Brevibacillus reuszeri]|uniref:Uncharacterized protein n=1 Tax=Brevibacillus reuszeri TaxID=54915 RepID=A0A0K9YYJ1_9BACL|nr:hypothetical protein [Brevibacillus reuszeri]KNB73788.1 hypothetical protein ADS79_07590 [Brevibacillus reuszeri]MED1861695.1 hypothetical protein [Brevibacillus reuszeri]GED71151.1 hypothetical protein BRE01_48530 [Brevibacillus reuszeri]